MEHLATTKYEDRTDSIKYIVLHNTVGSDSRNWLAISAPDASIHYLIMRDGTIYDSVPEEKRAWHAGKGKMPGGETDPNSCSIGIEFENTSNGKGVVQDYPEAQMRAGAWLVHDIMERRKIAGDNVVDHKAIAKPKGRKLDPVGFDHDLFWQYVHEQQRMSELPEIVKPVYTGESLIIGRSVLSKSLVADKIAKRELQPYTLYDIKLIVGYYEQYCLQAGLDWGLLMAQNLHETDWLRSYWSQRPRRNPAGLGVTGEEGKGLSFETWDIAVQAHVGHMLSYMFLDKDMNKIRLMLSEKSPRKYIIPVARRGGIRILNDLNGKWAVPGSTYGEAIAKTAMQLF